MKKQKTCNHILGYIDYESGYDSTCTDFVEFNYLSLKRANELKETGESFKFCPNCGVELESPLNQKIEELIIQRDQSLEEDRVKKLNEKKRHQELIKELSEKTKLIQLPDSGSFIVTCYPTNYSYGKDVVFTGTKEYILKSCVGYNKNKSNKDDLVVKDITKVFSKETFEEIMKNNGWSAKGESTFKKEDKGLTKSVSFDQSGMIYISETKVDSDGDKIDNYDRFSIKYLGKYLGIEIDLESINLI